MLLKVSDFKELMQNEPANKERNSDAVSAFVATTGIKPRSPKSGLNIT